MVTREEFLNNQHEYCKQNKAPFFMPSSGMCWKCKEDIVKILIERGEDGTHLVTGCPKCNRSYCD